MAKETQREIKYNEGEYEDSVGRKIIVDRISNSMYVVPKSGTKQYKIMRGRNAIVIALGMAGIAFANIVTGVIILGVCFLAAELFYRLVYLKKLQKITDQELPERPSLLEKYANDNNGTMILMCILSIALIIVMNLYLVQEVADINAAAKFKDLNDSIIFYGSFVIDILAIYIIYTTVSIFISRIKKGK